MNTESMTCERVDALLADWLEGALDGATRRAVDAHIAGCARCAAVAARLDEIPARTAALPPLEPSRDLWAAIAPRLEAPVIALADRRPEPRVIVHRRSWPARAAATAALMVATAGTTWYVAMTLTPGVDRTTTPVGTQQDPRAVTRAGSGVRTVAADAAGLGADDTYERELSELKRIVRERRRDLDPTTLRVLEKNLRVIDRAITQSRAALRTDPDSFLAERLSAALDKKLRLLRTVALLPSAT